MVDSLSISLKKRELFGDPFYKHGRKHEVFTLMFVIDSHDIKTQNHMHQWGAKVYCQKWFITCECDAEPRWAQQFNAQDNVNLATLTP